MILFKVLVLVVSAETKCLYSGTVHQHDVEVPF